VPVLIGISRGDRAGKVCCGSDPHAVDCGDGWGINIVSVPEEAEQPTPEGAEQPSSASPWPAIWYALCSDSANGFTAGGGGAFLTLAFAERLQRPTYYALIITLFALMALFGLSMRLAIRGRPASDRIRFLRLTANGGLWFGLGAGAGLPFRSFFGSDDGYFPAIYGTAHWWEFLAGPLIIAVVGLYCRQVVAMLREELQLSG
jgi:hypothetical protein